MGKYAKSWRQLQKKRQPGKAAIKVILIVAFFVAYYAAVGAVIGPEVIQ